MPRVRLAAIPLNQTPLAWEENQRNIEEGLKRAAEEGARLVCFPELSITGYGCEDAFLWPHVSERALRVLTNLLPLCREMVVSVGLPIQLEDKTYNGAALIVDGALKGVALKRHLAGDGLHYEPRWFHAWPAGSQAHIEFLGEKVPVGDLIFEFEGVRLGFEICEDAWVSARPLVDFEPRGVSLILSPCASHFSFGKHLVRRNLVSRAVEEFRVAYVYCNLLGNEAGRVVYDGDALIAQPEEGKCRFLAEARRLSYHPQTLACATLDLPERLPSSLDAGSRLVRCSFSLESGSERKAVSSRTPGAGTDGELEKEQALPRVLALGLFDYVRKSRSRGFVVSLSGGADSAAVALMVFIMVTLGSRELGVSAFLRRLGFVSPVKGEGAQERDVETLSVREVVRELLLTVYQATENSSEVTRVAARAIAEAVGAEHHEFQVEDLVRGYTALTEGALGRKLSWETDDVSLQNIQARVRAPSVWMLANVRGALLLSTSNRSEAAVGYATMDGDTAGGLCPLGGVDKAFLRVWLRFLEETGLEETGPMPALAFINQQQPTAELRPQKRGQTDEADLMPYEVLDFLERQTIVKRVSVEDVLMRATQEFPDYAPTQLTLWLKRFYRLFAANQWKRERYAPSFHVDDANLDPRSWCRFPILSGGFAQELAELPDDQRSE